MSPRTRPPATPAQAAAICGAFRSHFDLVCWNEANSAAENVQRPYLAARHIASEDFHAPADPFGIVEPMTELAVRHEDRPDERDAIALEIVPELDAFRSRVPRPITE